MHCFGIDNVRIDVNSFTPRFPIWEIVYSVCVPARPVIGLIKMNLMVTVLVQELTPNLSVAFYIEDPNYLTQVAPRPETPEPTTATFMERRLYVV